MKRYLLSLLIGFGLVLLLFVGSVVAIHLSDFNPRVIYLSQFPFRLPYIVDQIFFTASLRATFFSSWIGATLYVYVFNVLLYSVPIYVLLSIKERLKTKKSMASDPPPPPEFVD